jgi:hypothetical protein
MTGRKMTRRNRSRPNEERADRGIAAVRAAASVTSGWRDDTAEEAIGDALADIAHACRRVQLDPATMFGKALNAYIGDYDDGSAAWPMFDGRTMSFAEMKVWGE